MEQSYMKEKPILRLVVSMAMPMILSMMVNSLYNIIDSLFVARISEQAMTALSLVYPVQNLINAVAIGFGIGLNAVIAYFLGAGDNASASTAAVQGMLLGILHGAILTAVSLAVMPSFLRSFTSDTEIIAMGLQYSNIVFCFSVILAMEMVFEKTFQAVGKMTVTMICVMIGCISNILLDPLLIFGPGPFPALGIRGAALATGAGQTLTLIAYLIFYFKAPIPVKLFSRKIRWDWSLARKVYAVGIPAALNLSLPSLMISSLNAILSAFSQSYVLVLGIYYKLQTFLYLSANGIIQGIRPLVGYNYGAGEYKRVRKIYSTSLLLTLVIMALGTVLCLTFPEELIALFTDSRQTINIGARALCIISAGFLASSVSVVSSGTLEGLGMGTASLLIALLRYLVILVPVAFLLSRFIGAEGVWHAFWITEWAAAFVSWMICRKKEGIAKSSN